MQPPTGVVTPAQAGKLGAVNLGGDPMGLEEEGRELALEASALGDGAQLSKDLPERSCWRSEAGAF